MPKMAILLALFILIIGLLARGAEADGIISTELKARN
jgi:hypothetical protein